MDLFEYAEQQNPTQPQPEEEFDGDAIQQKFMKFHKENPRVYGLILKFIGEVKASGRDHYGIKGIFERIRWHVSIETKGDAFKLNNNYSSRYVRLIEEKHPELVGFFETRVLTAED